MVFKPHKMFVRRELTERDAYNRIINNGETWEFVTDCRCDDNNQTEFTSEDGKVFRPTYHIVCPRGVRVKPNDYIQVTDGDSIRGEGLVHNVKQLNVLDYSEVWV